MARKGCCPHVVFGGEMATVCRDARVALVGSLESNSVHRDDGILGKDPSMSHARSRLLLWKQQQLMVNSPRSLHAEGIVACGCPRYQVPRGQQADNGAVDEKAVSNHLRTGCRLQEIKRRAAC